MVSLLAVSSIVGVMVTVSLFTVIAGWDFGIIESVAVVIVIGFSVDYNVHLGHAYLEGAESTPDRNTRLGHSLLTMGISVVSGAITTMLSGLPLIPSMILFFRKMGIIIVGTVLFS